MCDWHTGKIKRTARKTLDMIKKYNGFKKLFEGKVDVDDLIKGLEMLVETSICSGCKSETGASERCQIRKCCSNKGYDLCSECPEFPCKTLKVDPGVVKWHCLENLKEIERIGFDKWIDKQWLTHINEETT
jgi:hypothetical protein